MGRGFCIAVVLCGLCYAEPYDQPALIRVAKAAIRASFDPQSFMSNGRKLSAVKPVFVTIEVGGVIRGCRGGLTTKATSLEQEIFNAAQGACAHDPRYKPLQQKELKDFLVTITIVEKSEPISTVSGLRPEDGLVLRSGTRYGIVLPWEGKDPKTRLKWAYQKAGVAQGSSAQLFRLTATRFRG